MFRAPVNCIRGYEFSITRLIIGSLGFCSGNPRQVSERNVGKEAADKQISGAKGPSSRMFNLGICIIKSYKILVLEIIPVIEILSRSRMFLPCQDS